MLGLFLTAIYNTRNPIGHIFIEDRHRNYKTMGTVNQHEWKIELGGGSLLVST